MTTIRLQQEKLEFTDDYRAFWNGKPFTGIVYDLNNVNGKLWSEMPYVNGWQDGVTREWSISGILIAEEHWRRGYRHGLLREWTEDGTLKCEAVFEFNYLITEKLRDTDGKLVHTFQISENDIGYRTLQDHRKRAEIDPDY